MAITTYFATYTLLDPQVDQGVVLGCSFTSDGGSRYCRIHSLDFQHQLLVYILVTRIGKVDTAQRAIKYSIKLHTYLLLQYN